jgi:hypothetical protein
VWRVIEPQLAQRDAQLDAVREVAAAMDGVTGARFWAEQLRAALRPQPPAAATPQPPLTWCAASMPGLGGEPIGPCVLRADHDGPVHQAATGARWWPTDDALITIPDTLTEQEAEAFRAAWVQHFADHVTNGSICIHSASRVAEALDQQLEA